MTKLADLTPRVVRLLDTNKVKPAKKAHTPRKPAVDRKQYLREWYAKNREAMNRHQRAYKERQRVATHQSPPSSTGVEGRQE